MGRGPRMEPELYRPLKQKIQSLDNTATRMPLSDGTSPSTMKNRILRVAAELGIPVTIRRVPGGLIFWRSTDEDLRQATDVSQAYRVHEVKAGSVLAASEDSTSIPQRLTTQLDVCPF
jgi:hypothetical protein